MALPVMTPAPGERLLRYIGDRLVVRLTNTAIPDGARGFLRTNLTRAALSRADVTTRGQDRLMGGSPFAGASWRDIPLDRVAGGFEVSLPLLEVGYFRAKAYYVVPSGAQVWPDGSDVGVSVHPNCLRTANLVYCAFPRAFGSANRAIPPELAPAVKKLDERDFTVIPPSGKLRDVTAMVPHIMDELGFRALHLLPIGPVPTTHARMGRYGSPYAALDLTGIDPALVEHDARTNAVDQFRELADAVHARDGTMMLDVVLNHTGWGSRLFDSHPEWFHRNADGTFKSPGAWGNTWADLVELDQDHVQLWHRLAESLATWCRRGIDAFRCDAGYMVPLPAWQFVIARVRMDFPDTLFFLEGLGGPWEATESLLTEGGMQWAYSELFQNYSAREVSGYLDHALKQSRRIGSLVNYAETHDNERLAARGAAWSLLRNRLSALAAPSAAYGITAGVEWLETAKIDVHEARPLGFGQSPNLVREIAQLTRLLSEHPCFFDGATIVRVSPDDSSILALERTSADERERCLVLANLDVEKAHTLELSGTLWLHGGEKVVDLLGAALPAVHWLDADHVEVSLEAGRVVCLSASESGGNGRGSVYRKLRAQAAWALSALGVVLPHENVGDAPFAELAAFVSADPKAFLGSLGKLDASRAKSDLLGALKAACEADGYGEVVMWTALDARRITLLPPRHWLLIVDSKRFEIDLEVLDLPHRVRSTETAIGYVVAVPPLTGRERDVVLHLDRYERDEALVEARIRVLSPRGDLAVDPFDAGGERVLLTNGRGGMARLSVDLGKIRSKYDCLLGANLHPDVPVDRHILVKRLRAWVNADGFITALDRENAIDVEAGPPAVYRFAAHAGDGRRVRVDLEIGFVPNENTVTIRCCRRTSDTEDTLPPNRDVRLTLRLDLEDRNFHAETHANPDTETHFVTNTRALAGRAGFEFRPAQDRSLVAVVDAGAYHDSPEWSLGLFHEEEATRGLPDRGDAWSPGWFDVPLTGGEPARLTVSAEPHDVASGAHRPDDVPVSSQRAPSIPPRRSEPRLVSALRHAARAYIVRRGVDKTVIAGYPWFLDWGRDSLIASRGLVAGGFVEEVRSILRTFGRFEENGTLPNYLSGVTAGSRESSDAPLWYALACEEYARVAGDRALAERVDDRRSILDVLRSIATHYLEGTPNGVRVDPESGLVWSPPHYTWMDTNYPAATPREGYPIELSALFARLTALLDRLGAPASGAPWRDVSERTRDALALYNHPHLGFFADTLHASPGVPAKRAVADDHLRPNQLFAVSLGFVTGARARAMVDSVARFLLVPGALRTLAPRKVEVPLPVIKDGHLLNDPASPYFGHYEGDEDTHRKPAYHNGTAWPWLLPSFCESLVAAYPGDDAARLAARAILGSTARFLTEGTIGQLPEILDGDAPHRQRGCDAQAWSVTETLRVAIALEEPG